MKKQIMILTKSSRFGKNCVVGLDIETKELIRLVSSDESSEGSISDLMMKCSNNKMTDVLDLVKIEMKEPKPTETHPEDWLIDENTKWEYLEVKNINDIPSSIFYKEYYIYGDFSPEINLENAKKINKSIIIVKVEDLEIYQFYNIDNDIIINKKTRANFKYNNNFYKNFRVTDPDFYNKKQSFKNAYLVITLPNGKWAYEKNKFFKLVAKIFPL